VIKVTSDKELIREIERISFNLAQDKEWSIRIAAMQRLEGILLGGMPIFSKNNNKLLAAMYRILLLV
jgi:CLIP-associating protein 1/2